MFLRAYSLVMFGSALTCLTQAGAQRVQTMHYAGTVGQQHVAMSLELAGDAVTAGHYTYDAQKSEIRIVDSRVIGSTVVLQDEDGNILHLHFESTAGEKAGSLPVKLTRSVETGPS